MALTFDQENHPVSFSPKIGYNSKFHDMFNYYFQSKIHVHYVGIMILNKYTHVGLNFDVFMKRVELVLSP